MKNKVKHAAFWLGVLLAAAVLQAAWPQERAVARAGNAEWPPLPKSHEGISGYGCILTDEVPAATENPARGWKVTVWADYGEKAGGAAHDWSAWLSWRAYGRGEKGREKSEGLAMQDCRGWLKKMRGYLKGKAGR